MFLHMALPLALSLVGFFPHLLLFASHLCLPHTSEFQRSNMSTKTKVSTFYILFTSLLVFTVAHTNNRETPEVVVGINISCSNEQVHTTFSSFPCAKPIINGGSSLPLPSNQELLTFIDQRLAVVYPVIQKFKSIITSDPLGITNSWVGSDVCNYKGFYCDSPPDNKTALAVASIDFNGFQLTAPTLDGFLDQLPDIALFHANSNNFGGTISPSIAKLPYLYELDISNNQFSGSFPSAVIGMDGLTFLDIRFNFFTGAVPPQIFAQNLDVLFINNNNFMMRLPDISSTHILYLTLANNKFTGPIPRSIFKAMSTLTEVLLLNNRLTGCLPYEIGLLEEAVVFDIGDNRLTGPLPFSLGCLSKVEQLNFAGNLLFGAVPEVICLLQNLVNVSLSNNYFTHVGPFCRILIGKGVIDVRKNCIPDLPFQRPITECAVFFGRPRFCPRMWSYNYIPREIPGFSSSDSYIPQVAPSP